MVRLGIISIRTAEWCAWGSSPARPSAKSWMRSFWATDRATRNGFKERFRAGTFRVGNCDWPGSAPREARLSFGGVQILAVHGDKYGVKLDYGPLSYYAEEAGAAIALFGHTHQPFAGYVGGTMLLNPGALNAGKYAILEIEKGNAVPS